MHLSQRSTRPSSSPPPHSRHESVTLCTACTTLSHCSSPSSYYVVHHIKWCALSVRVELDHGAVVTSRSLNCIPDHVDALPEELVMLAAILLGDLFGVGTTANRGASLGFLCNRLAGHNQVPALSCFTKQLSSARK